MDNTNAIMKKDLVFVVVAFGLVGLVGCHLGNSSVPTKEQMERVAELNRRGDSLRNISNFVEAEKMHEEARQLAQLCNDSIGLVKAYNNLGTDMRRQGHYGDALAYHYDALLIAEKMEEDTTYDARKNIVRSQNGIGNVYLAVGNLDDAAMYFHNALKGERMLGSNLGMAINYSNIGAIKYEQGDIDSALIYYKESMRQNELCHSELGQALCHIFIAEVAEKRNNIEDAIRGYKTAEQLLSNINDRWHWLNAVVGLARIYVNTNKLAEADTLVQKAKLTAEAIESHSHLEEIYSIASKIEQKRGHSNSALALMRTSEQLQDTISGNETVTKMLKVRLNYEKSKYLLKSDVTVGQYRRQVIFVIICAVTCIASLFVACMFAIRRIKRSRKNTKETLPAAPKNNLSNIVPTPVDTEKLEFLGQLDKVINRHIRNDDTMVDAISKSMGMSYGQLNRRMKKYMGYSLSNYIIKVRLRKAYKQVVSTNHSFSEIAYSCGFTDNSYFARLFKQEYGITPSQCRKAAQ